MVRRMIQAMRRGGVRMFSRPTAGFVRATLAVACLIGLPVLNMNASTIGFVQHVVRTSQNKIKLIVSYSRWWGWFGRPVAVPIQVVGIEGRQLVSLDMAPSEYAAAPTWQDTDAAPLADNATIRIALARN